MAQEDLLHLGLPCDFAAIEIGDLGDATWQGVAQRYWSFETYYLPVAVFGSPQDAPAHEKDARMKEAPVEEGSTKKCWKWRRWPMVPVHTCDKVGRGVEEPSEYWASPTTSREASDAGSDVDEELHAIFDACENH